MIRTFMAVELGAELRAQIAQVQRQVRDRLSREAASARIAWTKPDSMHLTLKFLGDIDERRVEALRDGVAAAVRDQSSIEIPLARLGAFPRVQEPRSLWIGAASEWERGDEAKRLASLVRALEDACAAEGVPREPRRFAPHLTLARVKTGERQVGRALMAAGVMDQSFALDPLLAASVAFIQSELRSDGAMHTRLWSLTLGQVS
jgi:2'-5' RNA ligase